ncbi:hypothetical protein JCM33374_g1040 [Metschnikowia sp. JCM 33374]|nr:hypothetical protein JCM33374_g1040 [Metschnikowia sp. JCM 33374]
MDSYTETPTFSRSPSPRVDLPPLHGKYLDYDHVFDAEIAQRDEWPAKAKSWLSAMDRSTETRPDIRSDMEKLEYYISYLGTGPSHVYTQKVKAGVITDFCSFLDWFTLKYIHIHSQESLYKRLASTRQTSTVKKYIEEVTQIERSGADLLDSRTVSKFFLRGLKNKTLAFEVRLAIQPDMVLDDIVDLVLETMFSNRYNAIGFPRGRKRLGRHFVPKNRRPNYPKFRKHVNIS